MPKFEAHITMPRDASSAVEEIGNETRWAFSAIDGDPIMGKKPYCYLTDYDTDGDVLRMRMDRVVGLLTDRDVPVLRTKIERIVFDSKTGVDELTVAS